MTESTIRRRLRQVRRSMYGIDTQAGDDKAGRIIDRLKAKLPKLESTNYQQNYFKEL